VKIVITTEKSLTDELAQVLQAHLLFCTSSTPIETGATEPFKPARQLYESLGYQDCEAFGDYVLSEDNTCMTKLI
jgi:hypothetical protein